MPCAQQAPAIRTHTPREKRLMKLERQCLARGPTTYAKFEVRLRSHVRFGHLVRRDGAQGRRTPKLGAQKADAAGRGGSGTPCFFACRHVTCQIFGGDERRTYVYRLVTQGHLGKSVQRKPIHSSLLHEVMASRSQDPWYPGSPRGRERERD
eukprot:scaffold12033_cov125-Isochrysis_galbana.AAC.5